MSLGSLIVLVLSAYMLCLVGRAVFSWIEPYPRSRIHRFLFDVTEPVIAPVRRLLPSPGGLDIAYMVVFFGVVILLNLATKLR